jgi:amino acid adenylation domain-containing protein
MTTLPRWTATPTPGRAHLPLAVPAGTPALGVHVAYRMVVGWLAGDEPGDDPAITVEAGKVLSYDTEAFDEAYARRFAGYLANALAGADFLPAEEREHLIHGRTGPAVVLPDKRFHELFAEVARSGPDRIAASSPGRQWTYGELDRAANRVANGLLAQGVAAEEVVGIAVGRTLEWLAAIIGVFKAGAAYLPIETDYPPARVAALMEQSRGRTLITPALYEDLQGFPDSDPGVTVHPGQLAYVYFTSGSTGLPKGAMCEHAGMVNHLLAKIADFELGPDSVVVENAQASFDISLWQLVAPLLAGGRTHIVAQEEILDVHQFLDTVVKHDATVVQVVPSYLDILLRETERNPRDLGRLAFVGVTGEAISKPLVTRFFAQHPDLKLVNGYGATEASDDTTHEVIAAPPAEELVPVGRPVANVAVYILGPDGDLRPLGSAGEIAFSGVCVGRGYINDPERTAEAFDDDPFRPGERIYRTGDYGRWLPSGTLEFHGRRDEQVKINGIRIELGEVEARLLDHPGVRTASVIVVKLPGAGKSLVGFYTGPPEPDAVRDHLRSVLPVLSVPARLHRIDTLPLNTNGKVDKKALAATALRSETHAAKQSPATETERRIAQVWAQALDRSVEQIGRDDHFFDLGGGSLTALRVVATLDGLIGLPDLLEEPRLRHLAARAEATRAEAARSDADLAPDGSPC